MFKKPYPKVFYRVSGAVLGGRHPEMVQILLLLRFYYYSGYVAIQPLLCLGKGPHS